MNKTQVIESLVEDMYLIVAGPEIDRVREQIDRVLSLPISDLPEDYMVVSLGSREYQIIAGGHIPSLDSYISDPITKSIIGAADDAVSTLIRMYIQDYCRKTPPEAAYEINNSPKGYSEQASDELDAVCALMLYLYRQSKDTKSKPGMRLVLVHSVVQTLDKQEKVLFSGLWRPCR